METNLIKNDVIKIKFKKLIDSDTNLIDIQGESLKYYFKEGEKYGFIKEKGNDKYFVPLINKVR